MVGGMKRYILVLRADEPALRYTSRKAALAVARARFGGRVYASGSYRTDNGDAVSLYPSLAECKADADGAHAARLTKLDV